MKNQTEIDLSDYGKYRYYKKIRNRLGAYKKVPYTRRLAIKYYCLECVGWIYSEMVNCTMPELEALLELAMQPIITKLNKTNSIQIILPSMFTHPILLKLL